MTIIPVILAGGTGSRLWPVSTKNKPKQLLSFLGKTTLLDQTIARLGSFAPEKNGIIITQQLYAEQISEHLGSRIARIMTEPEGRNTAPAVARLILQLQREQVDPQSILMIIPADHFIPDQLYFQQQLLRAAEKAADHNGIILLGITPSFPATGYGYIKINTYKITETEKEQFFEVELFHEKPSFTTASDYLQQNCFFWNSGILIASLQSIAQAFTHYQEELFDQVKESLDEPALYKKIEKLSLDHAILEKSSNLLLLPYDKEWYDVGSLSMLLQLEYHYGKQQEKTKAIKSKNNLALTEKKLLLLGVHNLRIIETHELLVITTEEALNDVKEASALFPESSL